MTPYVLLLCENQTFRTPLAGTPTTVETGRPAQRRAAGATFGSAGIACFARFPNRTIYFYARNSTCIIQTTCAAGLL